MATATVSEKSKGVIALDYALPEHDPSGEKAARAAYDSYLSAFQTLLNVAFTDPNLTHDEGFLDMLADEVHAAVDDKVLELVASSDSSTASDTTEDDGEAASPFITSWELFRPVTVSLADEPNSTSD